MSDEHVVITGERLYLRRLSTSDLIDFQAYRTDSEIARLQGWEIATTEESLVFLDRMQRITFFEDGQWFQLGVVLRSSNRLIGDVGICVSGDRAEIGYSIHASFHGQGFGSEAAKLAVDFIFASSNVTHVLAHADVRNVASWRVLERVGFTRQGQREIEYKGEMCEEYCYMLERNVPRR